MFEYPNPKDYEPLLDAEAWRANRLLGGCVQLELFDEEYITGYAEVADELTV